MQGKTDGPFLVMRGYYNEKSIFEVKILNVNDKQPQGIGLAAIVDLRIQFLDIEHLLILVYRLKDLRPVLVKDISAGPSNQYLG